MGQWEGKEIWRERVERELDENKEKLVEREGK